MFTKINIRPPAKGRKVQREKRKKQQREERGVRTTSWRKAITAKGRKVRTTNWITSKGRKVRTTNWIKVGMTTGEKDKDNTGEIGKDKKG